MSTFTLLYIIIKINKPIIMYIFVGWATTGWIFLQGSESFIFDTNYTSHVSGLGDDEQIRAVETAAMAAKRISQFLTSDTRRDTLSLKPDTNEERPQSQVNKTSRGRANCDACWQSWIWKQPQRNFGCNGDFFHKYHWQPILWPE